MIDAAGLAWTVDQHQLEAVLGVVSEGYAPLQNRAAFAFCDAIAPFTPRARFRFPRQDVLEPGRRSAFMVGLFQQVAGIRLETGEDPHLVLPRK